MSLPRKVLNSSICTKFKIEHESDFGYGKGWVLINNAFHRVLTELAFLPYGLFPVSPLPGTGLALN